MPHATFSSPDLDAFCGLDGLGLTATGQRIETGQAVLECRVLADDQWCHRCGQAGVPRGTVLRTIVHVPLGWRPTMLQVRVRRYRCPDCCTVWRQDTTAAAASRTKLSRDAVFWALKSVVIDRMSIARVAENLGTAWHTVNDAVLEAGSELLINDPARFEGVRVLGVDEHVWSHTRGGNKYVTVIIDLTPVRDGTGASRLLDMVPGRSKKVLKTWLDQQEQGFRDRIETVAMDGFTGFKTAAAEEIQQTTCGHRGRSGDPLYGIRRVLRTGADLLTDRQCGRLSSVFAADEHAAVEATWGIYQRIVQAYRNPDRVAAKQQLTAVIQDLAGNVPASLTEVITLGRTLKRRAGDVLAYFDRPGTSNGPTEAINGRLEHLRGTALGFRNLAHYILRSLLDTGGFRPLLHRQMR